MDALVKFIIEQWAVLMTAPAFIAALALGGLIGWAAAWIILKQRLDHYKERIEYFKSGAIRPRSQTQAERKRSSYSNCTCWLEHWWAERSKKKIPTPLYRR